MKSTLQKFCELMARQSLTFAQAREVLVGECLAAQEKLRADGLELPPCSRADAEWWVDNRLKADVSATPRWDQ